MRGDMDWKTLMGRSHMIINRYGLTLTVAIFNDLFSLNNKTYMNNIPMGEMVLLTLLLYVPFLTAPTLCPHVAMTLVMF